jgi:hypothetical protein
MRSTLSTTLLLAPLWLASLAGPALAQASEWRHSGSLYLLTTPEGASLPDAASLTDFPVLVRLHRDFFDFGQARPGGEDLRFSSSTGAPLAYHIEAWDPAGGTASIWVRVPMIRGNARQEIKVSWGNANAASESSGRAVFNAANGYLSVWHMSEPVTDEVGTLASRDVGTTATAGVVGPARRFAGEQGIFCGDSIPNYPSGASPHSSSAWLRAEKPNTTILGWGNEGGGNGSKVRMLLQSPPHVRVDSDFADVKGQSRLPLREWIHVVHTYERGESRLYVNGRLDGATAPTLKIRSPARLWIGGWYDHYDFVGDIDEVRISSVARSAEWIRLEYENQRSLPTLAGPLVPPGDDFSVSPERLQLREGESATLSARAGGAQKLYWILRSDGQETVIAVDRLTLTFPAGRVVGDRSLGLQLRAVCAREIKTRDIPVTIEERIPEPSFTLRAPAAWDGRQTIEVVPDIANLDDMKRAGAGDLTYRWSVSDIAVIQEAPPGKLVLQRAQKSGQMTVQLAIANGGAETTRAITILVDEPPRDAWVERTPAPDEKPQDHQLFARDERGEGTLHYRGALKEAADTVSLKVYAGDQLYRTETSDLAADRAYAFAVRLKPGLIEYRTELIARRGGNETVVETVRDLVCGDAYLINGQSNAEATDVGPDDPPYTSEWIRSYGSMAGDPQGARLERWGNAVCRDRDGGKAQIGYWGLELARRLVESQQIPICILNGAVGGTRIDQHQRSPADPEDVATIYGRLLWRARKARLTHGIRGILWHQGENDQGADGPSGGFGWETYRQYFVELAAAWKQDYPNLQHYYVFQIWPRACAMGIDGSDNRLREVQRTLPSWFSNLSVMSTLGIQPPGGCHYPPSGYAEIARLICPLLERDHYGKTFATSITPPDLKQAHFSSEKRDEIALEFDQPVVWDNALIHQLYLDGVKGRVASGTVAGNVLFLKLNGPVAAGTITYLDSREWSDRQLLRGENGIAALTFCEVPVLPGEPAR